jgi:hypothetical protein
MKGNNPTTLLLIMLTLVSFSAVGQYFDPTVWTNRSGGSWDSPSWASGLPQFKKAVITNDETKTIVFNAGSYAAYSNTPTFNLLIDGFGDTTNTVVLEAADPVRPISIPSEFQIGPQGVLENQGAIVVLNSNAFTRLYGSVVQTGGSFQSPGWRLELNQALFVQNDGSNRMNILSCYGMGIFRLNAGSLNAGTVGIGDAGLFGEFYQSGGNLRATQIELPGWYRFGNSGYGEFRLDGGVAEVESVLCEGFADYFQNGGTMIVDRFSLLGEMGVVAPGYIARIDAFGALTNGFLIAGSEIMDLSDFIQQGGTNQTGSLSLAVGEDWSSVGGTFGATYFLNGGTLIATNLSIGQYSGLWCASGTNPLHIYNPGTLTLGGELHLGSFQHTLGALAIDSADAVIGFDAGSMIHFADSSAHLWTSNATLTLYGPIDGSAHVYFGENGSGLSPNQLGRIVFNGNPAVLLSNGELVMRPTLGWELIDRELVLQWPGPFLLESAPDVTGPYSPVPAATSPWTNRVDGNRFFRLASP